MPAGRPPKPTALKILEGNPGKRPLNDREPKPKPGLPNCPSWLHKYAKTEWKRIVSILEPIGLLTHADMATLASYCQAVAELRLSTETLETEGRFTHTGGEEVDDGNGGRRRVGGQLQPHPAVSQQRSAWQAVKTFSSLFGLDPSSRSKIHTPNTPQDELEIFLASAEGE